MAGGIGYPLGVNTAYIDIESGAYMKISLYRGFVLIGGSVTAGGANFLIGVGGYSPGTLVRFRGAAIVSPSQDVIEIYVDGPDIYIKNVSASASGLVGGVFCFGGLNSKPIKVSSMPASASRLLL